MNRLLLFIMKGFIFGLSVFGVITQIKAQSNYNPEDIFSPIFYPFPGSETRSASGKPGPYYWQNRANYNIEAVIDTVSHKISATVAITYINNSPDNLHYLWLQLDQNNRRKDSKYTLASYLATHRDDAKRFIEGIKIGKVGIKHHGKQYIPVYLVEDTRMQIKLNTPLMEKGDSLEVLIDYAFTVPDTDIYRMGRTNTKNGVIYQIGQWYPRMTVYDDVTGWNTNPYLIQSEFYLEYGDFTFQVTAPANMLVAGSGDLMNKSEVLSKEEQKFLNSVWNTDSTILIHKASNGRTNSNGTKTWKFICRNARDVAWGASAAFNWDAVKITLSGGRKVIGMSFYPNESGVSWKHSSQIIRKVIEFNSKHWFEYPWNSAINVAGGVPGMEYPAIIFSSLSATSDLSNLIAHEFGHNWFPMIVGSNERKFAWMDEGLTTMLESHIMSYLESKTRSIDSISEAQIRQMFYKNRAKIMHLPMNAGSDELAFIALNVLRNYVLGKDRFDYSLRNYIKDWAYKHPTPWDFFRSVENSSGEDLNWYWRGMFFNNWLLDQSLNSFNYVDPKDYSKGTKFSLGNKAEMVMPVVLEIVEENGTVHNMKLPVEIWLNGNEYTFFVDTKSKIKSAKIDPEKQLPDIDRKNNILENIE